MIEIAYFILVLIFAFIVIEDFQSRTIRLIWFFLVLFLFLLINFLAENGFLETAKNAGLNLSFVFGQWLLLSIYFSIKEKRLVNINNKYIGMGDWFFLVAIAPGFTFFSFFIFYLGSLLTVLIISLILRSINRNFLQTIPLAGGMAGIGILLVVSTKFNPLEYINNDSWLITKIYQ